MVVVGLILPAVALPSQETSRRDPPETPALVAEFLAALGGQPSGEEFGAKVKEGLWDVYPEGQETKKILARYLQEAEDGPGVAFAAVALIPFHDASSVEVVLERAVSEKTSPATRWWLLNSAPYTLAIGDAMYFGDGALDDDTREFVAGLKELAANASQTSVGHAHALRLTQLRKDSTAESNHDAELALWHISAYLIGTLELGDEPILRDCLQPKEGAVFVNVMNALSFASGRDFLKPLREFRGDLIPPELEAETAAAAAQWWREYVTAHPDGSWLPAVIFHLRQEGYQLADSPGTSVAQIRELARALSGDGVYIRYAAARVLNRLMGTHFDLERIFLGSKYALSFLDPSDEEERNQERLVEYWQRRLP